jgi:Fe-S-cluster containining protein
MCCKGKGDLAYGCDSVPEDEDCPALSFDESGLACCDIQDWKPSVCDEYPFEDMNGMCERKQKEAGVWIEYVLVDGKLAEQDQKGNVTMCKLRSSCDTVNDLEGVL